MNRANVQRIESLLQPIANTLGVGFFGEDGQLRMEYWGSIGIVYGPEYEFLSLSKSYPICSKITDNFSLICFRLIGNLYVFVYYSWKADKVYFYIVDGKELRSKVNKLSSTMTDIDLNKFLQKCKNSMHLGDLLGESCKCIWSKFCTAKDWVIVK